MSLGFWQIAVIVILGVLLFGRGRISDIMGDVAKGIKSFKKGMSDDNISDDQPTKKPRITDQRDNNAEQETAINADKINKQ